MTDLPRLPQRTPKTLRAQMVRAEVGGDRYRPSAVVYSRDGAALSWSDVGGIVPARGSGLPDDLFRPRHTPRVDRRARVLRRLAVALTQLADVSVGAR